jgi:hypothetical protein
MFNPQPARSSSRSNRSEFLRIVLIVLATLVLGQGEIKIALGDVLLL